MYEFQDSPDKITEEKSQEENSQTASEEEEEHEPEKEEPVYERQDLFLIFTNERELRNIDQVRVNISQFTGIVIRTKTVSENTLHNLFEALEQDAVIFQQ